MTDFHRHPNLTRNGLPLVDLRLQDDILFEMTLRTFNSLKLLNKSDLINLSHLAAFAGLFISGLTVCASPILELRGIMKTQNSGWEFSIHEPETGRATWLRIHQIRNGYYVDNYDPATKTVSIQLEDEKIQISLLKSDDHPLQLQFSLTKLSPYNQQLFAQYKQLIITKPISPGNPTAAKEAQIEALKKKKGLSHFLMTNPSVEALNEHLGKLAYSIDYAALMKIDPGPSVQSRNAYNTAGWGIKKNVNMKTLEDTLCNNPSIEEIHDLVLAQ